MKGVTFFVTMLLIFVALPITEKATAQSATAAVDLTCTPPYPSGSIDVDVYPGASLTGYTDCTVSNPTVHTEKIEITVSSGMFAVAAPSSVTVAAGGESDFQVTVRADLMMSASAHSIQITARVIEISGVPPPNTAESTAQNIVNIKQFSQLSIEMVEPDVEIYVGDEVDLEYYLFNLGNGYDMFLIGAEFDETQDMKLSLANTKMELMSRDSSKFILNLEAPSDGSTWAVDSDGRHYLEMKIKITAESEYSCLRGSCVSMTINQNIVFYENQTSEKESGILSSSVGDSTLIYGGGGAGLALLLMLFLVIKRKRNS